MFNVCRYIYWSGSASAWSFTEYDVQWNSERIGISEGTEKNLTENDDKTTKRQKGRGKSSHSRLCAEGWESFNSKCYKHFPKAATDNANAQISWDDARSHCQSIAPNIRSLIKCGRDQSRFGLGA